MELCTICFLMFRHMYVYISYMCCQKSLLFLLYCRIVAGSGELIRFNGSVGFGGRGGLSHELVFGTVLGFGFRFQVRVRGDSIRFKTSPLPSLFLDLNIFVCVAIILF